MFLTVIYFFTFVTSSDFAIASTSSSLSDLISLAYANNPQIAESRQLRDAEESLVAAQATLDDPVIGISQLDRGNETKYGTITQKIRFPVKYFLQAKIQQRKADGSAIREQMIRVATRAEVTRLYYAIYSAQKIILLTKANMESVKEFARVAEKKYAAGTSTQGDSMKAHFELTQLELELIQRKQEEVSLQAELAAVLNVNAFVPLELAQLNLSPPSFNGKQLQIPGMELQKSLLETSPRLRMEAQKLAAAEAMRSLARWEFAPDVQVQYQKRISGNPVDSEILSVGLTIPFWFWKKGAEASAASAKAIAQEYQMQAAALDLVATVADLHGRLNTGKRTLEIYQTSLIPQASGAYNSSRSAYQANRSTFLDLLDSERSLYRVKTGYFLALKDYVATLGSLETKLGFTISDEKKAVGVNNVE